MGLQAKSLRVTAGITSKNSTNFNVSSIKTNPTVNLALLKLSSTIKPSHMMRPICLPIGKRYAGSYSTGMLVTFKNGPPKGTLQVIDTEVAIVNGTKCKQPGMGNFCAGPPGSVKCGGDTGGLLSVYRGGFSYEQIGVVADTVGCRSNLTPGIFTDVRKKTRWILNQSKDGNYCRSPTVTPDDLSSTTRVGGPVFQLNEEDNDDFDEDEIDRDGEDPEEDENDGGEQKSEEIGEDTSENE